MRRIDIVLIDAFPAHSLTSITEPLRLANRESLERVFSWRLLSPNGDTVRSSSGIPLPVDAGLDATRADAVLVLAAYHPERALEPLLLGWLRRRALRGELMGCVDTASMLFARAGLLNGQPAAAHHEAIEGLRDQFPAELFTERIHTFSPRRCSSAGGIGTIDMTLALIAHFASPDLARRVAAILNYVPHEDDATQGLFQADFAAAHVNRDLARCVELMHHHVDLPLSIQAIARRAGLPPWRMRRLFLRYLRQTPSAYYLELRLEQGRNLLRSSHAPVGHVAARCGFYNHETFSRAYKRHYGLVPSRDRDWHT